MTKGDRIVRNAAALLASQPLTWALTLTFTVLVPRNVGPGEWGEWAIGFAVGGLIKVALDLGSNIVLFKGVSRHPEDSERAIGTVLTLRLLLTPVLVLSAVGFSLLAGYSAHTRLIVALVALTLAVGYLGTPAVFTLQALEKMYVTAVVNVLSGLILTGGALAFVKFFALGIVSICLLALVSQAAGLVVQWVWLTRLIRIRPVLNWDLLTQLVREGMPYWVGTGLFVLYVQLDAILLSLLGSTHENGWYGVATQLISALGFLPSAVTTAVFPAMSRSIHRDTAESAEVGGRSFRLLVTLSLPMSAGLALVAHNLVTTIYGAWFGPAGYALAVLALTLPPVFIATLVNAFIVAADRQVQWTWVMGGMCALNVLLNLVTIPYFHGHYGNGALGAAFALLVTDAATGIAALALLPAGMRAAVRRTLPGILASCGATALMVAVVWPLRGLFLPIPIAAGAATFTLAALLLRVFPQDELQLMTGMACRLGLKPIALVRRMVSRDEAMRNTKAPADGDVPEIEVA